MKLGVVGDKQSVKGFAALGIDTFPVTNPDEVRRTIHKLAKEDYAVLFVTEQAVSMAEEAVNTYATSPFPAIIPGEQRNAGNRHVQNLRECRKSRGN